MEPAKKGQEDTVTIVGTGDLHPCQNESPDRYFEQCGPYIRDADIAIGQFEGAMSVKPLVEVFSPQNRVVCTVTGMAGAIARAGFNVISHASNHAMDGGTSALLETRGLFLDQGIQYIGAGANLAEARRPALLERNGTRVGVLAYCSVMPTGYEASKDRAGVAPLRAWTAYQQADYQPATAPMIRSGCYVEDLQALKEDVHNLRDRVHVVVVVLHFGVHDVPEYIADYEFEAARAAVDAGADLVLGHHAHILKGIEMYKGKAIFYGLGNFAMNTNRSGQCSRPGTRDWFYSYLRKPPGYPWSAFHPPVEPGWERFPRHRDARNTMIAKAEVRNGTICKVSFLPAMIDQQVCPQVLKRGDAMADVVVSYVEQISRSQRLSVAFAWEQDEVLVLEPATAAPV